MSWKGIITDIGIVELADCVAAGSTLVVNKVKIGTGTVAEEDMRHSTDLVTSVGLGTIIRKKTSGNTVEIRIGISPQSTAYTVKEIGIFGTVDGVNYTLLALYQSTDGISIPAISEFPDFSFMMNAVWTLDNTGSLEIEVDSTATVSYSGLKDMENTIIAPEYDATEVNNPGDIKIYNEELYFYKYHESTTGAFDSTKWKKASLAELLGCYITDTELANHDTMITVPFTGPFVLQVFSTDDSADNNGLYIGYVDQNDSSNGSVKAVLAVDGALLVSIVGGNVIFITNEITGTLYARVIQLPFIS